MTLGRMRTLGTIGAIVVSWAGMGLAQEAPATRPAWIVEITSQAQEIRRGGEERQAEGAALASSVLDRYAAAAKSGPVNWDEWSVVIPRVAAWLPQADRERIAGDLQRDVPPDGKELMKLSGATLAAVCRSFSALGRAEVAWKAATEWVGGTEDLRTIALEDLVLLTSHCRRAGEAGKAACARLAGHVKAAYLKDAGTAAKIDCRTWNNLAGMMLDAIPDVDREVWRSRIRQAHLSPEREMGTYKPEDFQDVVNSLRLLGDGEAMQPVIRLATDEKALKGWGVEGLAWAADNLKRHANEPGKAARTALANHISSHRINDAEAIRSVPLTTWAGIATSLKDELADDVRAAWSQRLRAAYLEKDGSAAKLDGKTLRGLHGALSSLGDPHSTDLWVEWVNGSAEWRGWKAPDLLWVVYRADRKDSEAAKAARRRVMDHVERTFLKDAETIRAAGPSFWMAVGLMGGKDLPEDRAAAWRGKLREAFGAVLADFGGKRKEAQAVMTALQQLGDRDTGRYVAGMLNSSSAWRDGTREEVLALATNLAALDSPEGASARAKVIEHLTNKVLIDAAAVKGVPIDRMVGLTTGLAKHMTPETRAAWCERIRSAYLGKHGSAEKLDPGVFRPLCAVLLTLQDPGARELLTQWVNTSTEWRDWKVPDLLWVIRGVDAKDADAPKASRLRVMDHVERTHLKDAEAIRAAGPDFWMAVGIMGGKDLPEERAAAWRGKLREAFGAVLADLGGKKKEAQAVITALQQLGDRKTAQYQTAMVVKTSAWQDWPPEEVLGLALEIAPLEGEEAALARAKVIEHLTHKTLADAQATKAVPLGRLVNLASSFSKHMTPEARDAWRDRIRSAYLGEGGSPNTLDKGVFRPLHTALSSLQDPRAADLLVGWVNASAEWQGWKVPDLLWVVHRIDRTDAEASRAARLRVMEHVERTYLKDAEAVRAAGPDFWTAVGLMGAKDLPAERAAAWRGRLRDAFGPVLSDVAGKKKEAQAVITALQQLGDRETSQYVAGMVNSTTAWQEWPEKEVIGLAYALSRAEGPEAAKARQRLIEHIGTKYLADVGATRKVSCSQWNDVVSYLGGDFTEDARKLWRERLRDAYASGSQNPADLGPEEFQSLAGVLSALGDAGSEELTLAMLDQGVAWKAWKPSEAAGLAKFLANPKNPRCVAARKRLLEHVLGLCLGDAKAVRAMGAQGWSEVSTYLKAELSGEMRIRLGREVAIVVGPDLLDMAAKKPGEYRAWVNVLNALGEPTGRAVVVRLVNDQDHWRSWAPGALAWLARLVGSDVTETARETRSRLGRHVAETYLKDPAAARSAELGNWPALASCVEELTAEVRSAGAATLRTAFASSPEAAGGLSTAQLKQLVDVLRKLNAKEIPKLLADALGRPKGREGLSSTETAKLIAMASPSDRASMMKLMEDLEKDWQVLNQRKALSWTECEAISDAWASVGQGAKGREWLDAGFQAALGTAEARQRVTPETLLNISYRMQRIGELGRGKGHTLYAEALASLARAGRLPGEWESWLDPLSWATPLGTKESLAIVEETLLDKGGHPRPIVLKILACAYLKAGEQDEWVRRLEGELSRAKDQPDRRALWLIGKGYQEAMYADVEKPRLPLAKQRLDEALAGATSPAVRLQVVSELATYYRWVDQPQLTVSLLESVKGQFGPEQQAAIGDILTRARTAVMERERRWSVAEQQAEAVRAEGMLGYCRKRLASAESAGDRQRAEKLRAQISRLNAAVNEALEKQE